MPLMVACSGFGLVAAAVADARQISEIRASLVVVLVIMFLLVPRRRLGKPRIDTSNPAFAFRSVWTRICRRSADLGGPTMKKAVLCVSLLGSLIVNGCGDAGGGSTPRQRRSRRCDR